MIEWLQANWLHVVTLIGDAIIIISAGATIWMLIRVGRAREDAFDAFTRRMDAQSRHIASVSRRIDTLKIQMEASRLLQDHKRPGETPSD